MKEVIVKAPARTIRKSCGNEGNSGSWRQGEMASRGPAAGWGEAQCPTARRQCSVHVSDSSAASQSAPMFLNSTATSPMRRMFSTRSSGLGGGKAGLRHDF
jgi:hypothetical protein